VVAGREAGKRNGVVEPAYNADGIRIFWVTSD
jgi:hypothetical protein